MHRGHTKCVSQLGGIGEPLPCYDREGEGKEGGLWEDWNWLPSSNINRGAAGTNLTSAAALSTAPPCRQSSKSQTLYKKPWQQLISKNRSACANLSRTVGWGEPSECHFFLRSWQTWRSVLQGRFIASSRCEGTPARKRKQPQATVDAKGISSSFKKKG